MRAARLGTCAFLVALGFGVPEAHAQRATLPPPPALVDYNAPNPDRAFADYARAAANVTFVNWTIWQIAWARDKDWAPITRDTLRDNVKAGFTFDEDELRTNFFGHPYHGGMQFNAARGAGLSFWEAALYTVAGSFTWEVFAEREPPSANDLASTALGGIMLGEITQRLSSAVLDNRSRGSGRLFRELAAAGISPMRGFDRASTGRAWQNGPGARRDPLRLQLELGVDQVRFENEDDQLEATRPAVLFALDARYGNLLPARGETTLGPFEFFELYAAANVLNSLVNGAHVYASGLLHGVSLPLSTQRGALGDNDVLGLGMNYEYVGANFTTYSGVGVGLMNQLVLRLGSRRTFRLSAGLDFVPVLGASSTEVGSDTERDYNFATGFSPWTGVDLQMGRFGELGLRMRHYGAVVVDGEPGYELIGSTRLSYEVSLLAGFGLGIAPTLVYRRGDYRNQPDSSAQQLSTQLYVNYSK